MAEPGNEQARDYSCREVVGLASEYLEGAMTSEQMTRVRGAPELLRRLFPLRRSGAGDRSDGGRPTGRGDPRRAEDPSFYGLQGLEARMKAYKFLTADGLGVFSRFAWPLPGVGPGAWIESEVGLCRAGIHACRPIDLPYWIAPGLYEVELDGPVDEQPLKVVAPRGRLIRRIDAWNAAAQEAYGRMCFARADELVAAAPERLGGWAPPPRSRSRRRPSSAS